MESRVKSCGVCSAKYAQCAIDISEKVVGLESWN